MTVSDLLASLGLRGDEDSFGAVLTNLGTVATPSLDEDEPDQHFDWVLIRRRGLEIGFADAAYFDGLPRALWRTGGLLLQQVTFYNTGRERVSAYDGELPYGLQWSDSREQACARLSAFESSRRSYLTDRWDIGPQRLVLAYKHGIDVLDSVHVKLRAPSLPPAPYSLPAFANNQWHNLFGLSADSSELQAALGPLDLSSHTEIFDSDEREIDLLGEAGLIFYFARADRLQLRNRPRGRALVLGAVKFHRERDLDARQYQGELPFGLRFDDSPAQLEVRVGRPPVKRKDGPLTGYARWHLEHCSLQVLYSTVENHLFRIMLMAPGYFQEMAAA